MTTLVVILVSVDRDELELWESDGRVVFFCFRLVETELVLGVENGVEFRLSEVVEFAKGVSTIVISLSSLSLARRHDSCSGDRSKLAGLVLPPILWFLQ